MSGGRDGRRGGGTGADLLDWGVAVGRMTVSVSLAAAEALTRARRGPGGRRRARADLDAIRDLEAGALDGQWREVFRLGEQLGRGMVDTAWRMVGETRGGSLDPERWGARAALLLDRAWDRGRHRRRPARRETVELEVEVED